jgi:hypothetical protein
MGSALGGGDGRRLAENRGSTEVLGCSHFSASLHSVHRVRVRQSYRTGTQALRTSSVVQPLPGIHEPPGSIPSATKQKQIKIRKPLTRQAKVFHGALWRAI